MESENVDEELRKLEELAKDSAVGETMYDKKSVIEKILEVGKHFQQTSYIIEGEEVRELDPDIEEKLCTLWDISVEEDVSKFYLEHGVLDIFIELFSNPNNRVKEIAAGIMSNMVFHQTVFLKLMEVDKYLESCSKLLEEKDSPTLVATLRILHSYSFNLFQLLNSDERDRSKEDVKNVLNRFLVYLSLERIVRNIGIIVASCTNREVLLNASKFLSLFSELWEYCEERSKVAQYFAEEQFTVCVLEAIKESVGEDKTEKHFAVFLNIIYENDVDNDTSAALSDKVLAINNRLLKEHVLKYNTIEESDLEFIFNLVYLVNVSLNSGGYESIPYSLSSTLAAVRSRLEDSGLDRDSINMASVFRILTCSEAVLETIKIDNHQEDDSCSSTSESSLACTPRTHGTPQTFDTPQSSFNTPYTPRH